MLKPHPQEVYSWPIDNEAFPILFTVSNKEDEEHYTLVQPPEAVANSINDGCTKFYLSDLLDFVDPNEVPLASGSYIAIFIAAVKRGYTDWESGNYEGDDVSYSITALRRLGN